MTYVAKPKFHHPALPKNALGFVKFLFPNDFNIYLHDTPNHELFKEDVRAFSHGCIRLANWDAIRLKDLVSVNNTVIIF